MIIKQDTSYWNHAIDLLCQEVREVARSRGTIQIHNCTSKLIDTPNSYDTLSSRYVNILAARFVRGAHSTTRNNYFDNNVRLQWKASRYEYFQQSTTYSKQKRLSLEDRSPTFKLFTSIVNRQETQFIVDSIVCLICLCIVAGLDNQGLRIVLLIVCTLESGTRYVGKSFIRYWNIVQQLFSLECFKVIVIDSILC